jgi:beta-glucosidase
MTVEVQVTNTGGMAAADVIQLYVEPPGKAVERPLKILVGFARVHLQPKQMEEVRVTVPMRRLAFFAEGPGAFVVEGGLHHIVVGTHAEDIGLRIELELEGMVVRD